VKKLNPRVVYVSVSGYGSTGPFAVRACHDLNAAALAGLVGERGDVPAGLFADTAAGLYGALHVVALLTVPRPKRRAVRVDVSMYDAAMVLMGLPLQRALMTETRAAAPGLNGDFACYRNYRCRDGGFMAVGALEPAFWSRVCEVVGLSRHTGAQWSSKKQAEVVADFEAAFAAKDRSEWTKAFEGEDVCVEPVLKLDEVLRSPLAKSRSAFGRQRGARSSFESPLLFASSAGAAFPGLARSRVRPKAPALGEHTDEVLRSIKYSRAEVAALREQGVVA
jgi:crotonobetainyl-CoA:carnitine CoA-transferase CaiB-like acyl-CoA transferase